MARVKAALRRRNAGSDEPPEPPVIRSGRLEINRSTFTVRIGRKEVFFPRKEFEILSLLASHPGKVFTREMLLHNIWGTDVVVIDRTVDVHIRKIREKLGHDAGLIETIKGVGYRFKDGAVTLRAKLLATYIGLTVVGASSSLFSSWQIKNYLDRRTDAGLRAQVEAFAAVVRGTAASPDSLPIHDPTLQACRACSDSVSRLSARRGRAL